MNGRASKKQMSNRLEWFERDLVTLEEEYCGVSSVPCPVASWTWEFMPSLDAQHLWDKCKNTMSCMPGIARECWDHHGDDQAPYKDRQQCHPQSRVLNKCSSTLVSCHLPLWVSLVKCWIHNCHHSFSSKIYIHKRKSHRDLTSMFPCKFLSANLSEKWKTFLRYFLRQMGAMGICHSIREFATQPVILWILLGGKPKWFPLNFGFNDVMRTAPIDCAVFLLLSKDPVSPWRWRLRCRRTVACPLFRHRALRSLVSELRLLRWAIRLFFPLNFRARLNFVRSAKSKK